MDHLVDCDQPPGASCLFIEPQYQCPSSAQQTLLLPDPLDQTKASASGPEEQPNEDSEATESADSENDMNPPSLKWELRRSSSSSAHSGEEDDAETMERRLFMKAYVEKVFHGR